MRTSSRSSAPGRGYAARERRDLGQQVLAGAAAQQHQHVGIAVDLPGQLVEQRQAVHARLGPRVALAGACRCRPARGSARRRPRRRARRGRSAARRPRGRRRGRSRGRPRGRTSSTPRRRAGRPSPAPSAGWRCRGRRRPTPSPRAPRSRRAGPTGPARDRAPRSSASRVSSSKERTNARPHQVVLRAVAPRTRASRRSTIGSGMRSTEPGRGRRTAGAGAAPSTRSATSTPISGANLAP